MFEIGILIKTMTQKRRTRDNLLIEFNNNC